MGYVVRLNHRKGYLPKYIGVVPIATDHDDDKVRALERTGLHVLDFENRLFDTFEEASRFPFPTPEAATMVIRTLPKTRNIDYEVVAVGYDPDDSMESDIKN
jgi:hypothetical protein